MKDRGRRTEATDGKPRRIDLAVGQTIDLGGIEVTVVSIGTPMDADAVVFEARSMRPDREVVEDDDGKIRLVPIGR